MSCGVETITAPVTRTRCAKVSATSPVPGGMSSTITSSAPQATWPIICWKALITIGPRQIMAVSSSTRNPIDITSSPQARSGIMRSPSISGFRIDAEHPRQARAIDVRIQQAHAPPALRQRHGQIHRHRALAHAALAGGHRNDRAPSPAKISAAPTGTPASWARREPRGARSARRKRSALRARAPVAPPPRGPRFPSRRHGRGRSAAIPAPARREPASPPPGPPPPRPARWPDRRRREAPHGALPTSASAIRL